MSRGMAGRKNSPHSAHGSGNGGVTFAQVITRKPWTGRHDQMINGLPEKTMGSQ